VSGKDPIVASLADFTDPAAVAMTPAKRSTPFRLGGISDRAIAWLFITPTVALLLAINISRCCGRSTCRSPTTRRTWDG
jgi:hypothetical protein